MFNVNQEDGKTYYLFYDLQIHDNYCCFVGETSSSHTTDLLLNNLWKKYYSYYESFQDFKYNSGLDFYIKLKPDTGHLVEGIY